MKCQECGKNFVLLANHVHKHNMTPDDYRRKYNIPLTQALADGALREHLSHMAQLRLQTEEGVEHIRKMLANDGRHKTKGRKMDLPEVSTRHCHAKNAARARTKLEECLPLVMPDWVSGTSLRDISIKHLVAIGTLRKWVRDGHLPKRTLAYKVG